MRVLLLYASLGAGHKRAAQALEEVLREQKVSYENRDLLEFLPRHMSSLYSWGYNFMITKSRTAWRLLYESLDRPKSPYTPAHARTQKWQFTKLQKHVRNGSFTHIVSTHFTPSALLTDWRSDGMFESKIYSVITDYSAHRCWKRKDLDHYFVASKEVKDELLSAGIHEERITVSGIPICSAFGAPLSREESRQKWNCAADDHVVLILCSALTLEKTLQLLNEVKTMEGKWHFLVSTGSDPDKEQKVKSVFADDARFSIVGFTSRIAEMMRAADVIVTKPGGLIVSEALGMGIPQLLLPAIPGQEEANANYACEHGAAICIDDKQIREQLGQVFQDQNRIDQMTDACLKIGKPRAAQTILDEVLS
jgi:processive 1,2-diacylglycerol beta-glucosyltransferase